MLTSKSVQFAFDANINAPQVNAQGSVVNLLDAVLVNGYGIQNIATLFSDEQGVVSASFNSAHGFLSGQILSIQGGVESELNGLFRVDLVTTNNVKFTNKITPNKSTSGSITAKVAPLGYEISFTDGAYKRVYKSLNPSNTMYYIFDDNLWSGWQSGYSRICNVAIATEMRDINTITGLQCPYLSTSPNLNWEVSGSGNVAIPGWAKIVYGCWTQGTSAHLIQASNGNHTWSIIGNNEGFYLGLSATPSSAATSKAAVFHYFGKYESKTNNIFNYLLCANLKRIAASSYQDVNSSFLSQSKSLDTYQADCKMFASNNGVNLSVGITPVFPFAGSSPTSSTIEQSHIFDESTGVDLIKIPFLSQINGALEGELPYVFTPLQRRKNTSTLYGSYTQKTFKKPEGNYFVEVNCLATNSSGVISSLFFELGD